MQRVLFIIGLMGLVSCTEKPKVWTEEEKVQMKHLLMDVQTAQVVLDRAKAEQRDSLEGVLWDQITRLNGMSREEIEGQIEELKKDQKLINDILMQAESEIDSVKKSIVY